MPYDIYGQDLRNGFCEVHPYVEQEYPCQICCQEIEREKQRQRENREYQQSLNEHYQQSLKKLYRPMTEFPPITEGEQHSEVVLVFDEDLDDCDLGFYNFDTQKWDVLGDFQMKLICWRHIEKPKYEDVQEYPTILTD